MTSSMLVASRTNCSPRTVVSIRKPERRERMKSGSVLNAATKPPPPHEHGQYVQRAQLARRRPSRSDSHTDARLASQPVPQRGKLRLVGDHQNDLLAQLWILFEPHGFPSIRRQRRSTIVPGNGSAGEGITLSGGPAQLSAVAALGQSWR